jgi:6-phosphogluconolactonase
MPERPIPELIVARDFTADAAAFIEALQPRTIALSGGETPRPVYERLANAGLPWRDIDVCFGDERCVPPDDPASNFRMAYEALLSRVEARVHRMPGESCDADAYERELDTVFGPGLLVFDLVVLGLGTDGHTASLFPGDPALEVRDRHVVRVQRPDHDRLSLTLPVLSAARVALFLVAGAGKRAALRGLLEGDSSPAARVAAGRIVVIADAAAAP